MKTIRLTTCFSVVEAHFIKDKLNNEGIECFLTNENITNLLPFYNNMLGSGIQVYIFEDDYQRASELIKDDINPPKEKILCPYCGSDKIGLKFGFRNLMNIMMSAFTYAVSDQRKPKCYCKNCKKEIP